MNLKNACCWIAGAAIAVADVPLAATASAGGWIPERRRDQFQNDFGYAVLPYVFELPGIGSGYGVLGAVNNVGGSYADVAGTFFEGDVSGQAAGVNSVHLIPKTLILDIGGASISRFAMQSYSRRGMDAGKDDYTEAELQDTLGVAARLTATFCDRRVEGYIAYYGDQGRLTALRDHDGRVIETAEDASASWVGTDVLGGRLDLTDDYLDPRKGVRFEPSLWWFPPRGDGANFFFIDSSVTAYLPVGKRSTWAFNYLCSDAYVIEEGETDPAAIAGREGLSYNDLSDPGVRDYIDNIVAGNTYGEATSLGGVTRLRSYPGNRYRGAHTQFFGSELRWNVTDAVKPFDFFIIKDVRTAIQIAPFYEIGTVADHAGDLWSITRSSYGAGVRVVTASGLIYRFDFAAGDEGFQPSIFFQYPWEL